MKYLLLLLSIFYTSFVHAYYPMDDQILCANIVQSNSGKEIPPVGNFYHGYNESTLKPINAFVEIGNPGLKNVFHDAIIRACYMNNMGAKEATTILPTRIIPIYSKNEERPIVFQVVYSGQDYITGNIGSGLLWGTTYSMNGREYNFRWLSYGALARDYRLPKNWKGSADAYARSLEEPFRSAPQLQMYIYLGKPLLVARSSTGVVTDVFFQGRDIPDPMTRAQKYLKDKWYHP